MNKTFLSVFLRFAFFTAAAQAVTVPISQDASSSSGKISAASGKATSLAVSSTKVAFLKFDLTSIPGGVNPALVTGARLRIYVASLKPASSTISFGLVTGDWSEEPPTAITQPPFNQTPFATALVATGKRFVSVDVTDQVNGWLVNATSNKGIAVTSGATLALGSKEGAGAGHPAELEIDVDLAAQPDRAVFVQETGATIANPAPVAGWQARTFTSGKVTPDTGGSVALAANNKTITLAPGVYAIDASAVSYAVKHCQIVLRDVTGGDSGSPTNTTAVVKGLTNYTGTGDTTISANLSGLLEVLDTPKLFELWHYVSLSQTTSGFGTPAGLGAGPTTTVDNRWLQLSITRVK